jgi:hypothetical protein
MLQMVARLLLLAGLLLVATPALAFTDAEGVRLLQDLK